MIIVIIITIIIIPLLLSESTKSSTDREREAQILIWNTQRKRTDETRQTRKKRERRDGKTLHIDLTIFEFEGLINPGLRWRICVSRFVG